MRYLTSISLALIVHVLLSIVVLMILACASTPAATPSGPMYSKAEAMAVLKEHLQTKMFQSQGKEYPCLLVIEDSIRNPNSVFWVASYNEEGRLWNIVAKSRKQSIPSPKKPKYYTWSVYDRTGSIVATGDDPVNQMC